MKNKSTKIKEFWDERAIKYGDQWKATLGEEYLRFLEISEIKYQIKKIKPSNVLDVGCGNGYSTNIYANSFPDTIFWGVDFSNEMIKIAQKSKINNCQFSKGDVLDIDSLPNETFDLIVTQRCLQNLTSYEKQKEAINNLISKKKADGTILLMECSKNGVQRLNRIRGLFGMSKLEGIEPWHNCFINDNDIVRDYHVTIRNFSSTYMLFAKVISPRLAKLGTMLPSIGNFGYDKIYKIK